MDSSKTEEQKAKLEKIKVACDGNLGDSIRKSIDDKIKSLDKEIKK